MHRGSCGASDRFIFEPLMLARVYSFARLFHLFLIVLIMHAFRTCVCPPKPIIATQVHLLELSFLTSDAAHAKTIDLLLTRACVHASLACMTPPCRGRAGGGRAVQPQDTRPGRL